MYRKFIDGIIQLGLTEEEIKKWHYCGGKKFTTNVDDFTSHENYYVLCFPNKPFLEQTHICVCKHEIINNGYICNENREWDSIIRIGSCCIKQFMPNGLRRTCETCGVIHRNIKINKCSKCRYLCCGKRVNKDEKCYQCNHPDLKQKQERISNEQELFKAHLKQEQKLALKNIFCVECDGSEMSFTYKMCIHCCCLKCENPNYKCNCG